MGKDNGKLLDFFTGQVPEIHDTHSIEEAVRTCARIANPGDTVLLSPCCASFDLFNSYEDRGRQFKEQVSRLSSENI
jgi:UDP-N-acetylmuramoylalanine--D-glutamate ligase